MSCHESIICYLFICDGQLHMFSTLWVLLCIAHCNVIGLESILVTLAFIFKLGSINVIESTLTQIKILSFQSSLIAILAFNHFGCLQLIVESIRHSLQIIVVTQCVKSHAVGGVSQVLVVERLSELCQQLPYFRDFLFINTTTLDGFHYQSRAFGTFRQNFFWSHRLVIDLGIKRLLHLCSLCDVCLSLLLSSL